MKKKIIILGSSGTLGKSLVKVLKVNFKVYHNGLKKRKLDVRFFNTLENFIKKINPDLIINCSAITNLDFCEKNKKFSRSINVLGIKNLFLIKKVNNLNFKLIQISTDQMYNNNKNLPSSENSKIISLNEYTKQKLEGEKICLKNNALVLRLNFFAYDKKNIFYWIINSCKKTKKINLFNDIFFNPLSVTSLSKIISIIIPIYLFKDLKGIYNLGCKDFINKSNFCIYIIKKLKLKNYNFKITNSEKFFKTKRPKNMRMNVNKFQKAFKIKMPYVKNEIDQYIKEINVKI